MMEGAVGPAEAGRGNDIGHSGLSQRRTRRSVLEVYPTFLISLGLACFAAVMVLLGILPVLHVLMLGITGALAWFCLVVSIVPMVEWVRERISA